MAEAIRDAVGAGAADFVDASQLAAALLGDSISTNLFMLGYAWQKGCIPLGDAALMRAIELNGARSRPTARPSNGAGAPRSTSPPCNAPPRRRRPASTASACRSPWTR